MANLLFYPNELINEIAALERMTARFLDPGCFQLIQLANDIKGLRDGKPGTMTLEIPRAQPLRTRVSTGEFEPAHKSSTRRVFAEVSGVWDIEGMDVKVKNPERPNKSAKPKRLIGFIGLASTEITVFDVKEDIPIAHWKMELGTEGAPGCFFHTFASADHGFPAPRHPNLFPTPMSAIEFAFGELFLDLWEREVSSASDPPQRWRSIQSKRLKALLEWQVKLLDELTTSPWLAIKTAKPAAEIFL